MLKTLKLVASAIGTAVFSPSNLHFRIANGKVKATNGNLAVEAPIASDLNCCPHAGQLIKALSVCSEVVSMHVHAGRLVITSGKFKTYVSLYDPDSWQDFNGTGNVFSLTQPLIPIFKKLFSVIAIESPRQWAKGLLIEGNAILATNSICLLSHTLENSFPVSANVPREAVEILISMGIEPVSMRASPDTITFYLPGEITVSSSLIRQKWPDVTALLSEAQYYCGQTLSGENLNSFLNDISKLSKFAEFGSVTFSGGGMKTSDDPAATSIASEFTPSVGKYNIAKLLALQGVAQSIGFECYPKPLPIRGENLIGVLIGMSV